MAADRGLDGRRRAGERHVDQVEFEGQPEQLAAQMRRRADAGTGKAVLAGVVPDELHQFRQCLGGHLRVHHHDIRRDRDQRHGREILDRIIRHLGVEAGIDDEAGADHHEGVAVRRHAGDLAGRDVAARAADVLDKELMAEIVAKFLGDDARDDIGRSASGKADHDAHRPARIALRRGCQRGRTAATPLPTIFAKLQPWLAPQYVCCWGHHRRGGAARQGAAMGCGRYFLSSGLIRSSSSSNDIAP